MQVKHDQDPVIICRSCGADYSADLPNCPYCGTMNLPAAESAYMSKLEHMRSNLEGLGVLAGQQTRKDFRSLRKKLLLAAVFLCLIVAVIYGVHFRRVRAEAEWEKAEILWQRDAFSKMDEYYASGDYESLLQFYYDAQDAGHHVWQYKRREFCEFLMRIENAQFALREVEAGSDDQAWLLYNELYLYHLEDLHKLSEEERAVLEQLRSPLLEDLDARFHLTDDELSVFRKTLARDGMISYADCESFLEGGGTKK